MSADAINQTSNAAAYHGVYRVSYSAFNSNGAFSNEFRINLDLEEELSRENLMKKRDIYFVEA